MDGSLGIAFGPGTALVVVDMQNDFADPKGSLYVRGGEEVVSLVDALIEQAERAGSPVVYTQDWHPRSTPHFQKDGGIWPVHCVAGSWGAELHPDLRVVGRIVRKGTGGEDGYSGFSMRHPETGETSTTDLEAVLQAGGAEHLVIVGLATDYCVVATALDARDLGFPTTVIEEAVRAVDLAEGDGARAIARMTEAGVRVIADTGAATADGPATGAEAASRGPDH